jgi:hypothetical protein
MQGLRLTITIVQERLSIHPGMKLQRSQYEFQSLWVRVSVDQIVAEGHRMRYLRSFGASWYSYSMRQIPGNLTIARYGVQAIYPAIPNIR